MEQHIRARRTLSVVAAAVAALSLGACDMWKDGTSAQAPAKSEMAKSNPVEMAPKPVVPAPPAVDENKQLAGKVKSALGADPALKMLAIDAGASDGVVTLYGTANTKKNRDRAQKVASGVPGVKSVKNELVIVAGS